MNTNQRLPLADRGHRAQRGICHMYGLDGEEYLMLWYETGCRYAEKHIPEQASRYIRLDAYWMFWATRWVDAYEHFVEWQNPAKGLLDFTHLALQSRKPGKIYRYMLQKTKLQQYE